MKSSLKKQQQDNDTMRQFLPDGISLMSVAYAAGLSYTHARGVLAGTLKPSVEAIRALHKATHGLYPGEKLWEILGFRLEPKEEKREE